MSRLSQYHSGVSHHSPVSGQLPRKGILVTSSPGPGTPTNYSISSGPQSLPYLGSGSRGDFSSVVTFKQNGSTSITNNCGGTGGGGSVNGGGNVWEGKQRIPRVDPWARESHSQEPRLSQGKCGDGRRHIWSSDVYKQQDVGAVRRRRRDEGKVAPWYTTIQEDSPQDGNGEGERLGRLASLSIADISPKLAHQRIVTLWHRLQYREAAAFIRRLSPTTFKQIYSSLPTQQFLDNLPQSLPILEAFYSKLFSTGQEMDGRYFWLGFLPTMLIKFSLVKSWQQINVKTIIYSCKATLQDSGFGKQIGNCEMSPENVIWQLVKFFASQEDQTLLPREGRWEFCGPLMNTCKRLISVLLTASPAIHRIVADRKKVLTKTIEGLGQHGMVGTTEKPLINLHDGLRLELQKVKDQYSLALHKLDELALAGKDPVTNSGPSNKAAILSSHQRQLSMHLSQIQERLIKNKTLLTTVDPAVTSPSLQKLINILESRVQLDKEVMFQYTSIKRETNLVSEIDSDPAVAPVLMKFQRGCHQVLELMREILEDNCDYMGEGSDTSDENNHADNTPFKQRSTYLQRSVRMERISSKPVEKKDEPGYISSSSGFSSLPPSAGSLSSPSLTPPSSNSSLQDSDSSEGAEHTKENSKGKKVELKSKKKVDGEDADNLRGQVDQLKAELIAARETILKMHEREEGIKQRLMDMRLGDDYISISQTSSGTTSIYLASKTQGTKLVERYGDLYSRTRVCTLESLDSIPELTCVGELKNKLLFSVVVLAFRSVKQTLDNIKTQIRNVLKLTADRELDLAVKDLHTCVDRYLHKGYSNQALQSICDDVLNQISSTLFDYPQIRQCSQLAKYIQETVTVSWQLATYKPAYTIEYEERNFNPELMVRVGEKDRRMRGGSDMDETDYGRREGNRVSTYIWPGLREQNGQLVYKAVVVTK